MSAGELEEHRSYLADDRKVEAYRAALAEVVRPGDLVLDIGTGSGLLGYLACEAGAGTVIAVDRGDIVELARRIAADNGYADRITHVQALSTGLAHECPADVAVCDQIGGLVHDAGVLSCFADARRLLAPGGTLVPSGFRISAAPVTCDTARDAIEFWSSSPSGIDVGAARSLAANTEWGYRIGANDLLRLAPGAELATFPSDHEDPIAGRVEFAIERAGRLDGYLGWFTAQLSPSVTLTNDPWAADRFDRWCNFYPLDEALEVAPGDRVGLDLDLRPRLGLVSWKTSVSFADGRRATASGSTFQGSFLASGTLIGAALDQPVPHSARAALVRTAIDLVDGTRTQADLVDALTPEVGGTFLSRHHLERFVRDLAALVRG
jgi:protein arginine N-methyltransferase 1